MREPGRACGSTTSPCVRSAGSLGIRLVLLFLAAGAIPACSDGGWEEESSAPSSTGSGWLTVTIPTSDASFSIGSSPVWLAGEAFIGAWGTPGVWPPVTWTNVTTGVSGTAIDDVDYIYFLGGVYPITRRWSASVPLAVGVNQIEVRADGGADAGWKTLLVTYP